MTQPLQKNLLGLPLAPAQCVVDDVQEILVKELATNAIADFDSNTVLAQYLGDYRSWIKSSKRNHVQGLDNFPLADFSLGTSESFDKFYLKHHDKRFRIFRGEYLYHKLSWTQQNRDWAYLDDEALKSGDAVIVSLPFADTGNIHNMYTKQFLDQCLQLNIPVLLDCAFFGICGNIDFDFTHPAIKEVCFSHSKAFPVSTVRIGIRFSKNDDRDSLSVYNQSQYVNKFAAALGLALMKKQTPDEIFARYRQQQLQWCQQYQLEASNTVIFGLDTKGRYAEYNRGYPHSNRLCFSKYFNNGTLPL